MNLKLILSVVILVLVAVAGFFWWQQDYKIPTTITKTATYKTGTYMVDGDLIAMVDGYSEIPAAPGSATKIITRVFGNEAFGDLNADGKEDVAFLLTQTSGGSGTFFYAVVALKTDSGYQATNAVLLGDRIAPQSTEIKNGVVTINYADRNPGEPMTTAPSVGVSKYLKVENGVLTENSIMPTFDVPQKMLIGKTIQFSDGLTVVLNAIHDSRCKPGVVCVWAGELSADLSIAGGSVGLPGKTVTLGTTTKKIVTVDGYTLSFTNATEASATIIVHKINK